MGGTRTQSCDRCGYGTLHPGQFLGGSLQFLSPYIYICVCVCVCVWEKTKVMRILRQLSPVKITIDQKQLENVKCFKYLGSTLTDDGRCTCEIKSRIAMVKAAFNKKRNHFTSKLDLNLRKKLANCYV